MPFVRVHNKWHYADVIVEDRELHFMAVPCQQDYYFFFFFPVPFNKQRYKCEVTILMDNSFGLI